MVHGSGRSPALVDELAPRERDVLVTVDRGIACHAGIAAAKAHGWQVLVADHHLPGDGRPPADAIVNPNQPGDGFGSRMLAGVGVIFYVLLALRRKLRDAGGFDEGGPDLATLLDLAAVGQIGRAHVCTPVTTAHLVCRLLLDTNHIHQPTRHFDATTTT